MATYTVSVARDEVGNFTSQGNRQDSMKVGYNVNYYVDVTDPNPENIGPFDVMGASGLPKVNRTIYSNNGYILPFLICRTKSAKRVANRIDRWLVSTTWGSSGNQQREPQIPQAAPAAITNISPLVEAQVGYVSRELFTDKKTNPQVIELPTGNEYDVPAMEQIGTLTLRITQYESSLSYETMIGRMKKVNQNVYRSKERYTWLIQNVEGYEVDVVLSGGTTAAALVTYTIEYSPLVDDGGSAYGWKDRRKLIDTHYLAGGEKISFTDGTLGLRDVGLIETTGEENTTGVPQFDLFETYETIDFDSFLQA